MVNSKVTTFSERLQLACAEHPDIPDYGKGLQTELAKQMKVSQEAVRKWLSGDTQPRQPMIIRLSKLLDVEYVWLALGTSELEFSNLKKINSNHSGAVHALISFMIGRNYNVAFVDDVADRADIHAIGHGVQRNLAVSVFEHENSTCGNITVPMPDHSVSLIGALPLHRWPELKDEHPELDCSLMYDFVWITPDILKQHGNRSGASWKLKIQYNKSAQSWKVGNKKIPLFLDGVE